MAASTGTLFPSPRQAPVAVAFNSCIFLFMSRPSPPTRPGRTGVFHRTRVFRPSLAWAVVLSFILLFLSSISSFSPCVANVIPPGEAEAEEIQPNHFSRELTGWHNKNKVDRQTAKTDILPQASGGRME